MSIRLERPALDPLGSPLDHFFGTGMSDPILYPDFHFAFRAYSMRFDLLDVLLAGRVWYQLVFLSRQDEDLLPFVNFVILGCCRRDKCRKSGRQRWWF